MQTRIHVLRRLAKTSCGLVFLASAAFPFNASASQGAIRLMAEVGASPISGSHKLGVPPAIAQHELPVISGSHAPVVHTRPGKCLFPRGVALDSTRGTYTPTLRLKPGQG